MKTALLVLGLVGVFAFGGLSLTQAGESGGTECSPKGDCSGK